MYKKFGKDHLAVFTLHVKVNCGVGLQFINIYADLLSMKQMNPHRGMTFQMKTTFTDSSRLPIQMQTFLLKDVL